MNILSFSTTLLTYPLANKLYIRKLKNFQPRKYGFSQYLVAFGVRLFIA